MRFGVIILRFFFVVIFLLNSAFAGICDRTQAIQDAIGEQLKLDCSRVTDRHLKWITELDLSYKHKRMVGVKGNDFAGLSSLKSLNLIHNKLRSLPDKIFAGLESLEKLDLAFNELASSPESLSRAFVELKSLKVLDLASTSLVIYPKVFLLELNR